MALTIIPNSPASFGMQHADCPVKGVPLGFAVYETRFEPGKFARVILKTWSDYSGPIFTRWVMGYDPADQHIYPCFQETLPQEAF